MFLFIDNTVVNTVKVFLKLENVVFSKSFEGDYKASEKLLEIIDSILTEHKVDTDSINGILVATGKGSFTASRISITVANTIGYVLDIPVKAIEIDGETPGEVFDKYVPTLQSGWTLALPEYYSEPNITSKQ